MPDTLPKITPELVKQLDKFAGRIMQYEYQYTRAVLMEKILKYCNGDTEKAKRGLYLMLKAKVIATRIPGKYYRYQP